MILLTIPTACKRKQELENPRKTGRHCNMFSLYLELVFKICRLCVKKNIKFLYQK